MIKTKNNIRKCIFTNQRLSKDNLIRIIIDNQLGIIDKDYSIKGRGFYILKDKEWIKKNLNAQKLNKKLKISNGESIYYELIN